MKRSANRHKRSRMKCDEARPEWIQTTKSRRSAQASRTRQSHVLSNSFAYSRSSICSIENSLARIHSAAQAVNCKFSLWRRILIFSFVSFRSVSMYGCWWCFFHVAVFAAPFVLWKAFRVVNTQWTRVFFSPDANDKYNNKVIKRVKCQHRLRPYACMH